MFCVAGIVRHQPCFSLHCPKTPVAVFWDIKTVFLQEENDMGRTLTTVVMAAALLGGAASNTEAQGKGGKTPPPVLVTSTVHDDLGTTLHSDGLGSYSATSQILSQIYSQSGDWAIDLRDQTERNVFLAFAPTQPPVGNAPYPQGGLHNARVLSRCFDEDTIEGFLAIAPGQVNETCSLRIGFTSAGISYFLVSSPLYAGTNRARVECVAPADPGAPCSSWTITPGNNPDPLVATPTAALYRLGKGNRETFLGYYELTYSINVAR
jgi:hypothetical protein